jgi:hypothetical protein
MLSSAILFIYLFIINSLKFAYVSSDSGTSRNQAYDW